MGGALTVRVGIPTEVKDNEYRVAITPAGVHELVSRGHEVFVQAGAGVGSSVPDADYAAVVRRTTVTMEPATCAATAADTGCPPKV